MLDRFDCRFLYQYQSGMLQNLLGGFIMSNNIRLSPDEMESIAGQYRVESGNVTNVIGNLDGLMDRLNGSWEGSAQVAFADQYDELKPSFLKMADLLEKINEQLNSTAEALRSTDSNIASQIRR